jgi:hypothetical protein
LLCGQSQPKKNEIEKNAVMCAGWWEGLVELIANVHSTVRRKPPKIKKKQCGECGWGEGENGLLVLRGGFREPSILNCINKLHKQHN